MRAWAPLQRVWAASAGEQDEGKWYRALKTRKHCEPVLPKLTLIKRGNDKNQRNCEGLLRKSNRFLVSPGGAFLSGKAMSFTARTWSQCFEKRGSLLHLHPAGFERARLPWNQVPNRWGLLRPVKSPLLLLCATGRYLLQKSPLKKFRDGQQFHLPDIYSRELTHWHGSIVHNSQKVERTQVSSDGWRVNKMCPLYTVEYYPALKRKEILTPTTTCVHIEHVMLSEISNY